MHFRRLDYLPSYLHCQLNYGIHIETNTPAIQQLGQFDLFLIRYIVHTFLMAMNGNDMNKSETTILKAHTILTMYGGSIHFILINKFAVFSPSFQYAIKNGLKL